MPKPLAWLKSAKRYPSLAAGIILVFLFIVVSIYTLIAIPYSEAISLWQGGPGVWDDSPVNASPVWFDYFTRDKLPRTIKISSVDQGVTRVEQLDDGSQLVEIVLTFTYRYDGFPKELSLITEATCTAWITLTWRTPDGRTIPIREDYRVGAGPGIYYISQDAHLRTRLGEILPQFGLFDDPAKPGSALKGDYQMVIMGEFPQGTELEAELVVYGQVEGLAGTDHRRRDLMVSLLWGAPIGLAFGVLAAVGAQFSTFVLAGIGTWLGGKVDRGFQWITQVNMILPVLPILIMINYFYELSLWKILGLVIALNVFSASLLTYRAMILQLKEAPYIEAAQAYGVGNMRMVFRYILPRIAPTLLPQFVLIVPTFVFLEASLAVLGMGDPILPTWGKVLNDAYTQGALYKGLYYWMVGPALLLMLMGVGFALIGFSLDRIFNPRLRTV